MNKKSRSPAGTGKAAGLKTPILLYRERIYLSMKMALQGTNLILIEVDTAQFAIIKSWNKMRWDKATKQLRGVADLELLDKLAGISGLTPSVAARRRELRQVLDAVDRERVNPHPRPFYKYPVKLPLYAHQVRGANMALLEFGWAPPERSVQK